MSYARIGKVTLKGRGNIVDLPVITTLDISPSRILAAALEAGMTSVVVCGFDADGDEYFASSAADGGEVLWHLKRAELKLLQTPDEEGCS